MTEEKIMEIVEELKPQASAPFVEGVLAYVSAPYPNPFSYGTWQFGEFEAGLRSADNRSAEGVPA